jgi:hypothetical protein
VKLTVRKPCQDPHININAPVQRVRFDDDSLRFGVGTADEISIVELNHEEARRLYRELREHFGDRI